MPKHVHHRIFSTSYCPRSTSRELATSSGSSSTPGSSCERSPALHRHLRNSGPLEADVIYPYTIENDLLVSSYNSDSLMLLKCLPCCDYDTVSNLLISGGFRSSVKIIRLCPAKSMALVELGHRRMAESAVRTFNGMPIGSFRLQAELRNGLSDLAWKPPKSETDTTVDLVKPRSSTNELYGSLRTDVYEDSSSDDNKSRSSSPDPLRPVPELRQSSIDIFALLDDPTVVNSEINLPLRFDLNQGSSLPRITSTSATRPKPPPVKRRRSADGPMPEDIRHPSTVVDVPTAAHSRARRLLVPKNRHLPLTTISMRSDAQFINHTRRCRISAYSLPFKGSYRHVEDACIIGDTVVVGYRDSPFQISLIDQQPERQPAFKDIHAKPHVQKQKASHVGVSSLCPMPNARFLSGGYDHGVYLWTTKRNSEITASVQHVSTLSATPNSLGYRECDRVLLACFGQFVAAVNLERPTAKPQIAKLSNVIHQIHQHPSDPNLTIFEVNHLDEQINIFDRRSGWFSRMPDIHFGRRVGNNARVESRYTRGGLSNSYHFIRGYTDGIVQVWDTRNVKRPSRKFLNSEKQSVVHACFLRSDTLAFGGHSVSFLD